MEKLESLVKFRGQIKVVPEKMPAKLAHLFAKKWYQVQSEFNRSVLKKLKDALEADKDKDGITILEEGIELIKQRNKLLVVSDKYGWQTVIAYTLDPISKNSEDEHRIKKARKEAKLIKKERFGTKCY